MIDVKGEYTISIPLQTMFLNTELLIQGTNLITLQGESFFLNRWINNEFNTIKYIVLGKSTARPLKSDTKLGRETVRKNCTGKADINTKKLNLTCDVTASEILDTTEIGVTNDEVLISHDVFKKISSTFLGNSTSTIHINYSFTLITGGLRSDWKTANNGIYYVYEPNTVVGVVEYNSDSGYTQVKTVDELYPGSYYYDVNSRNVYVKTLTTVDRPEDLKMIVQTK